MKEFYELHKSKILICFGFILGVASIFTFQQFNFHEEEEWESFSISEEKEIHQLEEASPLPVVQEKEDQGKAVIVDVKGEVKIPGVYQLIDGERVMDAILKAGGFTTEANSQHVNLAALLQDEMIIYVPKYGEEMVNAITTNQLIQSNQNSEENQKVNINIATEEQLTTLSGIGPSKAKAIIKYREENGLFHSIDDLVKVSGIGQKSLESIKDEITIGN